MSQFSVMPQATATSPGVQENASDAEAVAVTVTNRTITPGNLAAVFASPPALGSTAAAAVSSTTLDSTVTSATTNAPITVQTIEANTSGTAADGIGARQVWRCEDDQGNVQDVGYLDCVLEDVSDTTEDASFRISAIAAGSIAEVVRWGSLGISTDSGTNYFKYSTGTFTPEFSRSGITYNYSNQEGYYVKIGRQCHISIKINISTRTGSGSGNQTITTLPFTSYNGTSLDQMFTFVSATPLTVGNIWVAIVPNNSTSILAGVWVPGTGALSYAVTVADASSNFLTGTYATAS